MMIPIHGLVGVNQEGACGHGVGSRCRLHSLPVAVADSTGHVHTS